MPFWPPFSTVASNLSKTRVAVELNYKVILRINTKPSLSALGQPILKRLPALDRVNPSNPCHRRREGLHHGGDVCGLLCWWWLVLSVLFLSKESYGKGVFVPAGTHIAVKLLKRSSYELPHGISFGSLACIS
jgi:hypothetical protein